VLRLKINSDGTAANYNSSQYIYGSSSVATAATSASATTGMDIGTIAGGGSGNMSVGEITIPGYANTTFQKGVFSTFWTHYSSALAGTVAGQWASTAAITDLLFTIASTNFTNGSVFTLYGLK
jgi:hypothetical protein